VKVGPATGLDVRTIEGTRPVWSAGTAPGARFDCVAQVRAHGGVATAVAEPTPDGLRVELADPLRGVAPGQAVALYRPDAAGDVVLGSATITATA
jgi:tRNA-specific 2-thiouridylase